MTVTSTRSNTNPDAHRDFDGFDVDEELRRMREARHQEQWQIAAELAANLDEHLSLGGPLPVAWLGPECMQERGDLDARHLDATERATAMSPQEREDAIWGYLTPSEPPRSRRRAP